MNLNRRDFLLSTGIAFLARPLFAQKTERRKIIVAGAGLAGLSAAFELAKRGFEVTVIEARNRIGGRVFTLREPFSDGLYIETGGEIIGDGYKRFLDYAAAFGIGYEELKIGSETGGSLTNLQTGISSVAVMKGKVFPLGSELSPHPYGLTGEEAKRLPPQYFSKILRDISLELRQNPQPFSEFDKISLAELLRRRGVSAQMIKLIEISLNYNDIETVSAGGILWESRRRMNVGTKGFKLLNGNDQLPRILAREAERFGAKIILEAKIRQINHTPNLVSVNFVDEKGKNQTLEAEKFVCTIPFSVLREIPFVPALPETKTRAIRELAYTRITKTYLQAKRKAWDEAGYGSSIWTDSEAERIFLNSASANEERAVFTLWMDGKGADAADKISDKKRMKKGKELFETFLPRMKNSVEKTATVSWAKDEFARGAYSHFTVGQLTDLQPYLKTSVGAIHFAGEHTAENAPGMEGALESAERVVKEIAAA